MIMRNSTIVHLKIENIFDLGGHVGTQTSRKMIEKSHRKATPLYDDDDDDEIHTHNI